MVPGTGFSSNKCLLFYCSVLFNQGMRLWLGCCMGMADMCPGQEVLGQTGQLVTEKHTEKVELVRGAL